MTEALEIIEMLDPLLLLCVYLAVFIAGLLLIVISHPRVKSTDDMVYYKGRRDDAVPSSDQRTPGPTEERQDR